MPIVSYLPENTYTLEEFITAGRTSTISFDSLSYKDKLSNGTEISVLNVIDDYMEELISISSIIRFSTDEYIKYKFKPKLLCHDIYGNSELYYIIIRLNGIADIKEFDFKTVRMLKVEYMNEVLSAIYNAEYKFISEYKSRKGTE